MISTIACRSSRGKPDSKPLRVASGRSEDFRYVAVPWKEGQASVEIDPGCLLYEITMAVPVRPIQKKQYILMKCPLPSFCWSMIIDSQTPIFRIDFSYNLLRFSRLTFSSLQPFLISSLVIHPSAVGPDQVNAGSYQCYEAAVHACPRPQSGCPGTSTGLYNYVGE